jgi:hypothetical protein
VIKRIDLVVRKRGLISDGLRKGATERRNSSRSGDRDKVAKGGGLTMEELMECLLSRLSERGVKPGRFPSLLTDVFNIVGEGGDFTLATVNRRLEGLGWSRQVMDDLTLELLIRFLLDGSGLYQVKRHALH